MSIRHEFAQSINALGWLESPSDQEIFDYCGVAEEEIEDVIVEMKGRFYNLGRDIRERHLDKADVERKRDPFGEAALKVNA